MNEKKSLVIMFIDMVGYGAMVHSNEAQALSLLRSFELMVSKYTQRYSGNLVKKIGDGFLVSFESPQLSLQAGLALLAAVERVNMNVSKNSQLHLRIGIHSGSVVSRDGDLYGDVVNIAARLESQAKTDTICVAKSFLSLIKKPRIIGIQSIGLRKLKNISEPMELALIYRTKEALDNSRVVAILVFLLIALGFGFVARWKGAVAVKWSKEKLDDLRDWGGNKFDIFHKEKEELYFQTNLQRTYEKLQAYEAKYGHNPLLSQSFQAIQSSSYSRDKKTFHKAMGRFDHLYRKKFPADEVVKTTD